MSSSHHSQCALTANKIATLVPYKSIRIHFHHLTSSLPAPDEKTPRPWRSRESNPSRKAALHQRSVPFKSSFLSIFSCALDCNLMAYPSLLFPALTCFLKKSLELKRFPSTSSPIPPLKEKTPRRNKGQTTNCAVAFGI
jgi:hypothetical protein